MSANTEMSRLDSIPTEQLERLMEMEGLPSVSSADNGDVLTVVEGSWNKAAPSGGSDLPAVTSADNGDVLTVVDGAWGKASPSGGVFGVNCTYDAEQQAFVLDKTWQEICDAVHVNHLYPGFFFLYSEDGETESFIGNICSIFGGDGEYKVDACYGEQGEPTFMVTSMNFTAATPNDYPKMISVD